MSSSQTTYLELWIVDDLLHDDGGGAADLVGAAGLFLLLDHWLRLQ